MYCLIQNKISVYAYKESKLPVIDKIWYAVRLTLVLAVNLS